MLSLVTKSHYQSKEGKEYSWQYAVGNEKANNDYAGTTGLSITFMDVL